MNKKNFIILAALLLLCASSVGAQQVTWHSAENPVSYTVTKNADAVVHTALKMWKADMQQVTGTEPTATAKNGTIRIVQLDREPTAAKQLKRQGVPVDSLIGRNDGFCIKVQKGQLLVAGNNKRGTAYGILELSRLAGVSPWVWWSNVTPEKRARLSLPETFETLQVASVEYRGIFINDEDWTLQPWSWQHYEKGAPTGRMGAKTYRRVFELLMRLRANAVWPGMHGMSTPFYMVPGAKEQADSCGIVIGTSHCEPLARNNVGEWNVEERGRYNYVTNGEEVRKYWTERLQEARGIDNIYTIGMRGVHDGPMEGVKTRKEQTEWLQRVIDDQRELLKKYTNKNVEQIPQQFVPYKEVLQVMENGLQVPDDVMLTWCDDNYGYMTRLSDADQQKRKGGGGVYYHLSYWGRPIDYMWLCCTQPGLIYNEMMEAWRHNVRRLWIVNVHELKVAAYPLEFFLDMAWNIDGIKPQTINKHLADWLCREFGQQAGERLLPAMQDFYRLTAVRRPEFMAWNQVELDKKVYPRGWSPVSDTEFSFTELGNEADRYLNDWDVVCRRVKDAEALVANDRRDAFFSHVKYQVLAAAAMSTKMLEAQRARGIAAGNYNAARWTREGALMAACTRSMQAYQEIRQLTRQWNEEMAGGQWRGTMCDAPRDLYVFYAPQLPVVPTEREMAQYSRKPRPSAAPLNKIKDGSFVARNAADCQQKGRGAEAIQMLGHSMKAVALPKGESLSYDFTTEQDGEGTLYVALIPTQPNDKGDLRFSVSIDGAEPQVCSLKEKFRSEQWKLNVLRAQALKTFPVNLKKGSHRLVIKALDDHIIVDQWMVDFEKDRKFYVIPTEQQPVTVILTAGQSNADGRVPLSELPADISYKYCQCSYGSGDFKTATGQFELFSPTIARTALGDRWGFDAIVYHQLEQSLQQPFYVIKQTMGGTAIDPRCERSTHGKYWSADHAFLSQTKSASKGGNSLLKALTEQIDACIDQQLSRLPQGYDIRVLLWHQGESDKPQADSYHDNLQQVIAYIRQHLVEKTGNTRYATLPVVCGNFAKNSRQGSAKVAAALSQLAKDDKNFYVVDATDLSLQADQIHFDAKGAEALGRRVYKKLVEIGVTK